MCLFKVEFLAAKIIKKWENGIFLPVFFISLTSSKILSFGKTQNLLVFRSLNRIFAK